MKNKFGFIPKKHNLVLSDYLLYKNTIEFDWVIGNPLHFWGPSFENVPITRALDTNPFTVFV